MRRLRFVVVVPGVLATSSFSNVAGLAAVSTVAATACGDLTGTGGGGDDCKKGCPCGKACIDCSKTCHKAAPWYETGVVPDSMRPR